MIIDEDLHAELRWPHDPAATPAQVVAVIVGALSAITTPP